MTRTLRVIDGGPADGEEVPPRPPSAVAQELIDWIIDTDRQASLFAAVLVYEQVEHFPLLDAFPDQRCTRRALMEHAHRIYVAETESLDASAEDGE